MTRLIQSLDAHRHLQGKMTVCSWAAGWRSVLLRAYVDPPCVEEFSTRPTPDQLIVLVTSGACAIEGRYHGKWQRAEYQAGNIGMTAPGEAVALRWAVAATSPAARDTGATARGNAGPDQTEESATSVRGRFHFFVSSRILSTSACCVGL
jgi:hypothetical protein